MNSPPSLRDLYNTPSNSWSFVPSTSSNSTHSFASSSSSNAYQWSTRSPSNSLLDLSASLANDDSGADVRAIVQGLLASALLQYATTALSIPWDVGKTLLQVQWVPRDTGGLEAGAVLTTDEFEEVDDHSSNEDDSYFADPSTSSDSSPSAPRRLSDDRGYVIRQSVLEEATIPEYVIPVGSADGTWGMMKRLGRFRPEGWLSLWKGLLTSAITEAISIGLQPTIQSILEQVFAPILPGSYHLDAPVYPPPLLLPVMSQVLTGFILSPLDLVRTRLIVQSSHPRYRTYSGPIDALQQILTFEGGLKGVYFHPHLLLPTLIDCTLRSLVPFVLPGLVASYLSFGGVPITPETHPVIWGVAEFLGSCAGLIVTLPFETIRRRLQVQVRGTAKPIKGCVELRPAPYNGMVDTFWHIMTEERSDLPLKTTRPRRRRGSTKGKGVEGKTVETEGEGDEDESWLRHTGVGQLYRGLGMRIGASVTVFVLAMLSGGDEPDSGWAEL